MMRRRLLSCVATAAAVAGLVACGSSSDSRDRNVELQIPCAQGGACNVGDAGPGGGIVFFGGNSPEDVMWEAAPVNGYGTHADAELFLETFDFGGLTDWVLPTGDVADQMWNAADEFACDEATDCATAYAEDSYWTADEVDGGIGIKSFVDGTYSADLPLASYYIRPVRQFQMQPAPIGVTPTTLQAEGAGSTTSVADETSTTSVDETTTTAADETTPTVEETTTTASNESTTTLVDETTTATQTPTVTETTLAAGTENKSCAEGGPCQAGDTGPSGGTVVLADSIPGESATLIEVAPVTWFGNAAKVKGFADNLVYGSRDDWQVPTLNQMLAIRAARTLFVCPKSTPCTNGFANSPYWAVGKVGVSHVVDFGGNESGQPEDAATNHYVRPVRVIADLGVSKSTEITVEPTGNFDPQQ